MNESMEPDTTELDKRALAEAKLAGTRRRVRAIRRRVIGFAATVMLVAWMLVLSQTWNPGGDSPGTQAGAQVQQAPAYSDEDGSEWDDDDGGSAPATSAAPAPAPAPAPPPVTTSQS